MHSIILLAFSLVRLCASSTPLHKSPSNPALFKNYTLPSNGLVCALATGSDSRTLWYFDSTNSLIGALNSKTGAVQEYHVAAIPSGNNNFYDYNGTYPPLNPPGCFVTMGKDNLVYAGSSHFLGLFQLNPKANPPKVNIFGNVAPVTGWAADQGVNNPCHSFGRQSLLTSIGKIFFTNTTKNATYLFDYETHKITTFKVPWPYGVRTDAYNNAWVASFNQEICEINNVTGRVTSYPYYEGNFFPQALQASTEDERYLWASEYNSPALLQIDTVTKQLQQWFDSDWNAGIANGPGQTNANDYCGRVWIPLPGEAGVGVFDPVAESWQKIYDFSQYPSFVGITALNRGPGQYMWWSYGHTTSYSVLIRYRLNANCTGRI